MAVSDVPRIPLQLSRDSVVASIQVELNEDVLRQFRSDLLTLLHSSGVSGVILDASGVLVMDRRDFDALRETIAMAGLMGARSVIAGLGPGIVSSLVELGADIDGIEGALDLDDAFRLMDVLRSADHRTSNLEEDDETTTDPDANGE